MERLQYTVDNGQPWKLLLECPARSLCAGAGPYAVWRSPVGASVGLSYRTVGMIFHLGSQSPGLVYESVAFSMHYLGLLLAACECFGCFFFKFFLVFFVACTKRSACLSPMYVLPHVVFSYTTSHFGRVWSFGCTRIWHFLTCGLTGLLMWRFCITRLIRSASANMAIWPRPCSLALSFFFSLFISNNIYLFPNNMYQCTNCRTETPHAAWCTISTNVFKIYFFWGGQF